MAFWKIKTGHVNGARDVLDYIGEIGHLFYSQDDNVIRISDGHTLGGIPLSGGSMTFSGSTAGSTAPNNPSEGNLWWNTTDGRLYIYYDSSWVDASPESVVSADDDTAYATQIYVNSQGFITTAALSGYATQTWVNNQGFLTADNDSAYATTATVTSLIANSLTNYATQVYVNSQGFITTADLTGYATETWVTNHNYLQVETGVHSVTGTANQVIVTDLGNRDIQLSTPQNLNSTATVTFGNLTVNNLNVLNTLTSVVPAVVDGYRIYLASTSTSDTQINGGGIVLGTSTWQTGILYSLPENYWYTLDSAGFQTEHLISTKTTVSNLTVLTNADIGYSNLQGEFANALLQIDAASDTYSQVNFQNHSSSTWASGDYVITNDIGTDGAHYIDMGINSSRYSTSTWVINGANDGYLYIDSGNLAIGTTATEIVTFIGPTDTTDSIISVANATTITYSVDLMPSVDAEYYVGKPGLRWAGIYVGTGSVWIQDISLGTDAELTVDNGVLYINGAYQIQVGQLKFFENTIESTTGGTDIQIGLTTSTANIVLNRNVVLAAGKTFGLVDTVLGTTATMAVTNGVLTVNGANQLQVGQLKFIDNTIESITPSVNIQLGYTTDTGNVTLNRNLVLGSSGTAITFYNGSKQITAWNSTATVLWNQITGTPAIGVTSITTGTGIRVDHSTGTVNISFANDGGYITSAALATYATQTYVNSQGFITSSALTGYATQTYVTGLGYTTTASVTALIANSLTNYATQTYVTTRGYISSSSLSVATGSAVSGGALAYSTTTGVFTFNPATAYSLTTATSSALGGVKIGSGINAAGDGTISVTPFNTGTLVAHAVLADTATTSTNAGYAYSFNTGTLVAHAVLADTATTSTNAGYAYSFNTSTLVTTAVTANSVAGGYVSSITAGTGTQVSSSTGAVTVWAVPQAITSTGTTQASNYTIDLSGPTFIHWQPSANGARTITLTGFTPGRRVEVFITPHTANDIFTVSGVTGSQCSNGHNTFTMNGVGASEQSSFILQIYCTTSDIGGVWIYGNGSL